MRLNEHPLRRQVVGEMHLRRWPAIHAPAQIAGAAFGDARRTRGASGDAGQLAGPIGKPRHAEGELAPGISFVWEQHSEACGITLFMQEPHADPSEAMAWIERFPGQTMRATRIHVVENQAQARDMLPQMGFVGSDLISCLIGASGCVSGPISGSGTKVWAFRWWRPMGRHPPILRAAPAVSGMGNYRNLALMGLPVAQAAGPGWMQRGALRAWPPMSPARR
jgi:uncharacterized membrane-anchored protein